MTDLAGGQSMSVTNSSPSSIRRRWRRVYWTASHRPPAAAIRPG